MHQSQGTHRDHQARDSHHPLHLRYSKAPVLARSTVASSFFVNDRNGDADNLNYGSLNKRSIPQYRAIGRGHVLGLSRKYRIGTRSKGRLDVENVDDDTARNNRKHSLLSAIPDQAHRIVVDHPKSDGDVDQQADFIELEHRRKRRRMGTQSTETDSEESFDVVLSESEPRYSPEQRFEAFKSDLLHIRQIELRKAVNDRPQDLTAWLALIGLQDVLVGDDERDYLRNSTKAASLKVPLYQEAMTHIRPGDDRDTLIMGLMHDGGFLWDADKQKTTWKKFQDENNSFRVWKGALNFAQTNPITFSVESCLEMYKLWLDHCRNRNRIKSTNIEETQNPGLQDSQCTYILLRLTLFLWQSGFRERAVGIWQGLLECNFGRSQPQSEDFEPKENFNAFWDKGKRRFGESGSQGWCTDGESMPPLDPVFDIQARYTTRSSESEHSGISSPIERSLEKSCLPARPAEELGDDLDRVVLFSDIDFALFEPLTLEGRWLIIDAFLIFAGLPPVSTHAENISWQKDPFLHSRVPERKEGPGIVMPHEELVSLVRDRYCKESATLTWGRLFNSQPEFVRRVIHQLARISHLRLQGPWMDTMTTYAAVFDSAINPSIAIKMIKSYLVTKGDSIRLYDLYASLHFHLGRFDTADKVWSTALFQRMQADGGVRGDAFLLWRNWIYAQVSHKRYSIARKMLSMTAEYTDKRITRASLEQESADPGRLASRRVAVESHIRRQIESTPVEQHVEICTMVNLLALHEYFNNNFRISAAIEILGFYLNHFSSRSIRTVEAIHEQRGHFMAMHVNISGNTFKPEELYTLSAESVRAFPENWTLFRFHRFFTYLAGLMDRLRQADTKLQPDDRREPSVLPSMFAIEFEMNRPSYSRTNYSLRSAFQRATTVGSPGRHSIELWTRFIEWEAEMFRGREVEKDPTKAKATVEAYQEALQACPWSKELGIAGCSKSVIRQGVGEEVLQKIHESMVDRGLRVEADFRRFLESVMMMSSDEQG